MIWDMMEKADLDFDEKTEQPKFPTIYMHPDMMKAIAPKLPEWRRTRSCRPAVRKS
jgi:hypothetical protein